MKGVKIEVIIYHASSGIHLEEKNSRESALTNAYEKLSLLGFAAGDSFLEILAA
jgi:hypothetical protein